VDDTLEWVWAYRQSLCLLDQFDAEGLDCAGAGETVWASTSWKRFLNTYGLKQGLHASLRDKPQEVFNALAPLFKTPLDQNDIVDELTKRWLEGVSQIGKLAKTTKSGFPPKLTSISSKLLWFYHPVKMTMYDQYAAKGLESVIHRKVTPENFLCEFEKIFTEKEADIVKAGNSSDRIYPYPRRVLDQWLWFKGNNKAGGDLLHCFKLSLCRAPFR
jgi:hypothetical protein